MKSVLSPVYPNRPISNISSLSKLLGVSSEKLQECSANPERYYKLKVIEKKGKERSTYIVKEPLKTIQSRIHQRIFERVQYPFYLQGGIRAKNDSRGPYRAAQLHAKNTTLVKEDISNFFPSIKRRYVRLLWLKFFHFHPDIAHILTQLTTYNNMVPQGAKTSTDIANLIFWDIEPDVVSRLMERGFTYTRYVDDIIVSSKTSISDEELHYIRSEVYRMLSSRGVTNNKEKKKILHRHKAQNVHGYNTNSGKATIPKRERKKLRAAVKQFIDKASVAKNWDAALQKEYDNLMGRIGYLKKSHPKQFRNYKEQISAVKMRALQLLENK